MPDWDVDSPQLRRNLTDLLRRIRDGARRREEPGVESLRRWHEDVMRGLDVPAPQRLGKFRGEEGLEGVEVRIGTRSGELSSVVPRALDEFDQKLKQVVGILDQMIPSGADLDSDQLAAVIDLCAWAHAEWVRIHPFANGNGRTARLLANSLAMRYGLPPFVRLRPRPDAPYAAAGQAAMQGNWQATVPLFARMLDQALRSQA